MRVLFLLQGKTEMLYQAVLATAMPKVPFICAILVQWPVCACRNICCQFVEGATLGGQEQGVTFIDLDARYNPMPSVFAWSPKHLLTRFRTNAALTSCA